MLQLLAIAIALSIDAFGLGISFGVRKIRMPLRSLAIITFIGFLFISVSLLGGNMLQQLLPDFISALIGSLLLIAIGCWIVLQSLKPDPTLMSQQDSPKEIFHLIIKSLGITINIVRTPEYSDLNHSNTIEPKEAIYLGTALSIDSVGVCIGTATTGISTGLLPLCVLFFQVVFILIGISLGNKLNSSEHSSPLWTLLSGSLVIIIGISQLLSIA